MTMLLAIGPSPARCFKPASVAGRGTNAPSRDAFEDRPPIPRAVIDWPIGAGDPATDVKGAATFRVIELKRVRRRSLVGEAVAVGVLFVAFLALAGLRLGASSETALLAKTPHVDARVVDVRPASPAADVANAPEVAPRRSGEARG